MNSNLFEKLVQYTQKVSIVHIILASFSLHMFLISQPSFEILDESYFTNFMRSFIVGIDHTPYQLPGLSFVVTPFVKLFGDNWLAWRLPIIILGMVFLYFYYKVIEHIADKKTALFTSIILSLSPMIFVHSSLMLRDIPIMALGFFSIWLYFKRKYHLMGIVIGLSALIKESAIFFLLFIVLYEILCNRKQIIIRLATSIEKQSISILKKPVITFLLIVSSFLIPLAVYDNTISVLEYDTRTASYFIDDKTEKHFWSQHITSEILQKDKSEFNFISEIKDPIHHLKSLFFKGYYDDDTVERNGFLHSFLPILQLEIGETGKYADINTIAIGTHTKITSEMDQKVERHSTTFGTNWYMSTVNYSWWHVGFWSLMILIGYAILNKVKNKVPISKNIIFMICGLSFFIPFLFVNLIRDTFSYYMIYFLPFMAFGLVCVILKIPNKKIRVITSMIVLFVIGVNFMVFFPLNLWQ